MLRSFIQMKDAVKPTWINATFMASKEVDVVLQLFDSDSDYYSNNTKMNKCVLVDVN